MKKLILGIICSAVVLTFNSGIALADEGGFKAGKELDKSACVGAVGNPVINIEQKVKNDADSGVAGNNWALDNYVRQIRVYKTTVANQYCALVSYDGSFITFAGISPQNTGTVGAGIKGEMKGGYRGIISGSLKTSPSWATKGNVGTFNYACDVLGNCPGRVSWLAQYFDTGYGFDYAWWGWGYKTAHNGSWINSAVNSGDITGIFVKNHDNHDEHGDHDDHDD